MKYIYAVVHTNPFNNFRSIECAFSTEAQALEHLRNMYLNEEGYECYNCDIEAIELDPEV